jgi:5'(3')-deoxyribonucleotidase
MIETPTPAKLFNCFIDSDGPIADYELALSESGLPVSEFKIQPGIYLWLKKTPGAEASLEFLKDLDTLGYIRVWVLTKTPSRTPYAYTEKVLWYRNNFPWLEDRVILCHDKHLVGSEKDYLLDDRPHKANANLFRGNFWHFNVSKPELSWKNFIAEIDKSVKVMLQPTP